MEERLYFDSKINKKDTCLVDKFNSPSINQKIYNKKSVSVYKEKKANGGKENEVKKSILYPVTDFSPYFKIYVLEKLIKIRC
jgi:hypothetical protein